MPFFTRSRPPWIHATSRKFSDSNVMQGEGPPGIDPHRVATGSLTL